ncbi:hypothetical protein AB0K48_55455, partial [Nonomuraea sp. NPDC055795]
MDRLFPDSIVQREGIPQPQSPGTGYNYSVAIVHENQNCSQGGTISQWYQRNRILDLDAYWVDVIRRGDNRPYSGAPGTVARDPASTPINLATCTFDGVS